MIRRILAIGGSAIFLVLAPGFVAGMVPWWISHWRVEAALLGLPALIFWEAFCSPSAPSESWIHLAGLQYRESARRLRFFRRGI